MIWTWDLLSNPTWIWNDSLAHSATTAGLWYWRVSIYAFGIALSSVFLSLTFVYLHPFGSFLLTPSAYLYLLNLFFSFSFSLYSSISLSSSFSLPFSHSSSLTLSSSLLLSFSLSYPPSAFVGYFDPRTGALQAVCWSKSFFWH